MTEREARRARLAAMPKVELHVHLEGAIQPETLLRLARKNGVALPATTVEELREWYRFTDFGHFAEVYVTSSQCIQSTEDLEAVARDFLAGQAAQNVLHTEATFTALTLHKQAGLPFDEQIDAIGRAAAWAEQTHQTSLRLIIDVPRGFATDDEAMQVAHWIADSYGRHGDNGLVAAFGLGGFEIDYPPERYADAFAVTAAAGVPAVIHAGETGGPDSVRGALEALDAVRIGHGVRALEDPEVMAMLRARGTVLEVCPSSNVCLGVVPSMADHPLPAMIEAGLAVTLNSDDPPLFNTTLNDEYVHAAETLGLSDDTLREMNRRAAAASLLPDAAKQALLARL